MGEKIEQLLRDKGGINLDIGCGANKQHGYVGIDIRPLDGVDIVHDLEVFPYPLPDNCCLNIIGSHIYEHISPQKSIGLMNELWRIMKVGGKLALAMPYAGSHGYWQDPTHCNPANETTFLYFDHREPLWNIYQPKTWEIDRGFPVWQVTGQLEVLLTKVVIDGK